MNPHAAASSSSQAPLNPFGDNTTNPCQIHTAQASSYWAGRFMALEDRFRSEMLMPENLKTLLHAHAERSLLPVTRPSLASSATMSCITPSANPKPKPKRSVINSMSPRKQPQAPSSKMQQQQQKQNLHPPQDAFRAAPRSTTTTTTVASARSSFGTAAAVLVDDDNRCRRIFLHLDALCTTSEARISL
jgi:hypothetical protein